LVGLTYAKIVLTTTNYWYVPPSFKTMSVKRQ